MDLLHTVVPLFEEASYLGIFILIIVSGYILPVPEDLFLIVIGYLVYAGVFPLIPVVIIAILATFVHDQILFYLGKSENERAKWFLERFSKVTMLNHEELVRDHLYRIVFYSRFIPFVRLAGPLLAGSEKVPWKKFALVDFAAVSLYAPLSIGVG
ncbi:MAG: VTT domain-containing protein, partial [Chitinophagaceae bacterium]